MKDLVAEILTPRKLIKLGKKTYWIKQNIPWELKLEAKLVYQNTIDQFRFSGMLCRKDIYNILMNYGVEIDRVPEWTEELTNVRVELYKKYPDEFAQRPARSHIADLKKKISETNYKMISLDGYTLEAYAEKLSAFFILQKLGNIKGFNLTEKIYNKLLYTSIGIAEIRKLARDDYWRAIWLTKKGAAFKYDPLTDEQISLSSFSRMYDSIYKHPERPPDEVISDDDMIDGWLTLQNKPKEKKVSYGSKIDSSNDIFIMAQNQDHANKIYSMNTDEQRAVQNVRGKQLKKLGAIQFGQFADQRRAINATR